MNLQFITDVYVMLTYLTSYCCKPEHAMSEFMKKAPKEAYGKDILFPLSIQKGLSMQVMYPLSVENKPQLKPRNKVILQNHSKKSFQKLLKFRTWFCLPCTLHLNMACFKFDIYYGYFKKTVQKLISMLLLTICKYFTICTCSKPMDLNLIYWLCIALAKSAFSLQISCL